MDENEENKQVPEEEDMETKFGLKAINDEEGMEVRLKEM